MSNTENIREALQVLSKIPYFTGLDTTILGSVAQTAIQRYYDTGQIIFLEGEECAGLYVVQTGWLKAVKFSPTGREQVLRFLGPDEVFPEVGLLIQTATPATVIALEPTTLWFIQRETMLALLGGQPELARMVIQNLAQRVLYLLELVEDLSLRSVEARLARLLLTTGASDGIVLRRQWATQAEMAARLGTVPDVLHRALRSLVEAKLIEVDRHRIKILNRQALQERTRLDK